MLTKAVADEFIKKYASKPKKDAVSGLTTHPLWLTGRALDLWQKSEITEIGGASKHDAKFYLACLRLGRTDDEARATTELLPGGKAYRDQRDDESYWESTKKWAHKHWDLDQAALTYIKRARGKDALLERFVDAMARVHDEWPDQYERAIRRMRKKGVRTSKLEKAVHAARARDSVPEWDGFARHAVSEGVAAGWWYKGKAGWVSYSSADWARNLTGRGVPPAIAAKALADDPWTLVAEPFQPEELEGRKWNRNSACLAFKPKLGKHPTWTQLFRVLGRGIEDAAVHAGFASGSEYLFLWVASVFQRPKVKLPYLFFYGEAQDAGKSTFHEALKLLLKRGYVLANEALENTRGFNSELHGAVVCAADEIEIGRKAYKRIKQWTTGETIQIHPKGKTPYDLANFMHFIQTGNVLGDCPLVGGDTRITTIHVRPVDKADKITKEVFLQRLLEEGAAITHSLLNVELPGSVGRLGLPILESGDKQAQQKSNQSALEEWIKAQGPEFWTWSDRALVNRFLESLPHSRAQEWDPSRVTREIPRDYQIRRRLAQAALSLVANGDWRGSTTELRSKLGGTIVGDWDSLEAMSIFLTQSPLPGLSVERLRGGGKRVLRLKKA